MSHSPDRADILVAKRRDKGDSRKMITKNTRAFLLKMKLKNKEEIALLRASQLLAMTKK